jgi:hypothetical protein
MGSFIIRPVALTQGGLAFTNSATLSNGPGWYNTNTPPILTLLQCLTDPTDVNNVQVAATTGAPYGPTANFADVLRFDTSFSPSIYLDGSATPIDFQHLPQGFIPTAATVKVDVLVNQQPVSGISQFWLELDPTSLGTVNTASFPYVNIPPMFDIVFNGIGIKVNINVTGNNDGGAFILANLRIEGTYGITHNTGITANTPVPVNVGDPITINTVAGTNIAVVTGVIITYVDTGNNPHTVNIPFTITNPTTITAVVPDYDGAPVITVNITGTIFTGVVPILTNPTINFKDGSGIYQLVSGKLTDSAYANGFNPIQIVELAIPNPFIKTGFIP